MSNVKVKSKVSGFVGGFPGLLQEGETYLVPKDLASNKEFFEAIGPDPKDAEIEELKAQLAALQETPKATKATKATSPAA